MAEQLSGLLKQIESEPVQPKLKSWRKNWKSACANSIPTSISERTKINLVLSYSARTSRPQHGMVAIRFPDTVLG
jgi:hypothetical protein